MVIHDLQNAEAKYQIILSDPPWEQKRGQGKKRHSREAGGPLDYPTLPLSEIKAHLVLADGLIDKSSKGGGCFSSGR